MILLTHICDRCHTAITEEIVLVAGQVEYVNMPQDWEGGICPDCQHTLKIEAELEAASDAAFAL
ncbi:MAG: hypothetical protein FD174_2589 [Geobacteraceae bacterium]|nr:MAG: hypothetical protein FD174_2589 [Geobacteraceae bacterium]